MLDPASAEAYRNRGTALVRLGRFQSSIDDFTRAIELGSNDPQVYVSRGIANRTASASSSASRISQ